MLFSPFFICKRFHRVLNLPRQSFVLKRDFLRLWNLLSLKFACWPRGCKGWKWNGAKFSLYTIFIDKVKKKCWSFLGEKKKFTIIWIPIHYEEIEFKVCWHWQLIFTSYSSMISRQHCSIILSQVYSFFTAVDGWLLYRRQMPFSTAKQTNLHKRNND